MKGMGLLAMANTRGFKGLGEEGDLNAKLRQVADARGGRPVLKCINNCSMHAAVHGNNSSSQQG